MKNESSDGRVSVVFRIGAEIHYRRLSLTSWLKSTSSVSGAAINHYISVDPELGAYNQQAAWKASQRTYMPITIDDIHFSGFPGRDFPDLARLTFRGRVDWVEYRFQAFFLETFDRIVALEHETYVWLCVVNLLTSAVDALAHFEFDNDSGPERFARFVERYFDPIFTRPMRLSEPPNAHGRPARTSAEHFYKYFRSGLAHSFCIEWGGLLHREDGAPEYLFETPQGHNGQRALGIVPRELVRDFRQAVGRYFAALRARTFNEPEFVQFNRRFEHVYHNKAAPPLP